MAKLHSLTARQAQTLGPGTHADGGNLFLRVRPTGSRAWVFRYKVDGKAREIGLGALDTRSLAEARKVAADMRKAIADGQDPAHVIRPPEEQPKPTFTELAAAHIEAMRPQWRNAKHAWQWGRSLEMYVYPTIGDMTPDAITTDHILRVLSPIWTTKPETAQRVRQRIEAIMARAVTLGYRPRSEGNPALWKNHLDTLLPAPKKVQKVVHHPAIPHHELSALMSQLRGLESVASYCLQFITLTACRSGEARGATWSEFDLAARTWTIPGERMKAGRSHVVPLSPPAIAILEVMRAAGTRHVFASPYKPRQPLTDIGLIHMLHRIRPDISVHGMRSAFRDWCSEKTSFANEVVELSLAHVNRDKTEAAYFRSDLLEKRRELMAAWARYLDEKKSVVVALRSGS
ncbi:integrase arm-type DNA-binding domain-containing protein [Acidithiobacillus sp. CV18-2]|nr:integrase arm-type DNA-binding domain-containing protein [Acidithiobacillus sp. CV18-3]MBU2758166.1 integrase arm-type DNA-binding domain-containing protein [Acidithiobacillus sp. BN09-2]MBU2776246.1 integrase arm-type DNA-binding domain-containing protein [Acidithiobacillus sp. CV18-2]MBU2799955.1 integrase arm-type DNA-binding domain-containing protein [Acidithiobacillus sp. VAN18-4]